MIDQIANKTNKAVGKAPQKLVAVIGISTVFRFDDIVSTLGCPANMNLFFE